MTHTFYVSTCFDCGVGESLCKSDINRNDNFIVAFYLRKRVLNYIRQHDGCSCYDIYVALAPCSGIVLYLCLAYLVENLDIVGQNPYACGAPQSMKDMFYTIARVFDC